MRKFGIRLWLVKRLLDSLIFSCIDEYDDVPLDVNEGIAHLHSALEDTGFKMKIKKAHGFPTLSSGYQPKADIPIGRAIPPTGGSGTIKK